MSALVLVVSGCGDDEEETGSGADQGATTEEQTQEATGEEPSGELYAFGFGYDTGDEIAQVRVDRFRDLHPDVQVSFSESGFEEQPFLSALAGDDPPDVVNIPRNELGTYAARGVLTPLDESPLLVTVCRFGCCSGRGSASLLTDLAASSVSSSCSRSSAG